MVGSPDNSLYESWLAMRSRCVGASKSSHYADVSCDPRWSTFEGFRDNQPAGRPFEPGLVLARTADTGDYSPENTRWATKTENAREAIERRMLLLPDGRFAADVAKANGISQAAFDSRVKRGWDLSTAATEPVTKPKLTAAQEAEVLRRYATGATQKALAIEFGVGKTTIGNIIRAAKEAA